MKKLLLTIFALCLAAGIALQSSGTKATATSAPALKWVQTSLSQLGTSLVKTGNAKQAGGNEGSTPPQALSESEAISRTNDLSRKAVMTETERRDLNSLLSSKSHIDTAVSALRSYAATDLENNQKTRMAAGLFLLNALDAKDNPANQYVREQVAALVLDPALEKIDDLKLKRSVVADRVELYLSLKRHYPQDADQITESASTDLHKRIITFANSLGNINKKGI